MKTVEMNPRLKAVCERMGSAVALAQIALEKTGGNQAENTGRVVGIAILAVKIYDELPKGMFDQK